VKRYSTRCNIGSPNRASKAPSLKALGLPPGVLAFAEGQYRPVNRTLGILERVFFFRLEIKRQILLKWDGGK
jgi:hypothetical protein